MTQPSDRNPGQRAWRALAELVSRLADRTRPATARVRRIAGTRAARRTGLAASMLLVTLAGAWLGLLLGGHARQDVGPFSAEFSVSPGFSGGTDVQIPPLGSLELATHSGPAHLSVRLDQLDQERAVAVARDPNGLQDASTAAVHDTQQGVRRVLIRAGLAALAGALLLATVVYRDWRRVATCGGLALALLAGSGAVTAATLNPDAVEEPTYHGLLTNAPAIIGDAKSLGTRYSTYQAQLSKLFANVTKLYATFNALPTYEPDPSAVRVLHVSDLHLNPQAWPLIETMVTQFKIHFVIDTGDLNDWGTVAETGYAASISNLSVPYLFIQGNHDSPVTAAAVAKQRNAVVLANQIVTEDGLRIAGIDDPLFTPDKSEAETTKEQSDVLAQTGTRLADTIRASGDPVDIALVHDPAMAGPLAGTAPLILAGHLHKRQLSFLADPDGGDPSAVMVQGSTGGAGLRGLEHEEPTPLELSVLYFDGQTHMLQAYDDVTVGGTGRTDVTLQRHIFSLPKVAPSPTGSPSPSPGTPTGGPPGADSSAIPPTSSSPR
jgi:predicted MPP superfamily phosphohydrolase